MTQTPHPKRLTRLRRRYLTMVRYGLRCAYCGLDFMQSPESFMSSTLDHFKPKSKGGNGKPENMVACCKVCNELKGANQYDTFAEAKAAVLELRKEYVEDYYRFLFVAREVTAAVHPAEATDLILKMYEPEDAMA